jgi:hypothetical protein
MGWSVVAANGSYNWTRITKKLSSISNASNKAYQELSQYYAKKHDVEPKLALRGSPVGMCKRSRVTT